ncbi:MAG TPA: adenosylmethionine--8-amino-7-oxononanoate transaminase [Pirellulaceae bacterium]|nr:adenosylmethionine--8-amino-7-oxononanoate transaminase [Pirellulaceae bacterium]
MDGSSASSSEIDRLEQADRAHLWHAFTPMARYQPWIIERGEGFELIDVRGRRFLDAESGLWCNVHGHRHPRIDRAIRDQLDRISHVTLLGMTSDVTVRLAVALIARAPEPLRQVFFSSDGASAVEVAMKLAFEYHRRVEPGTSRDRFLCFDAAYHGDTIGTLSVGGVDRFNRVFRPLMFPTLRAPIPDSYRRPSGVAPEQAADAYLAELAKLFAEQGDRIAAAIIEPRVQCAAGMIVHPDRFLAGLRDLCTRHGALLIADEIAVGCGRTGTWSACEAEGVVPDLLCLGKGLSAGYLPLSATLVAAEIVEAFRGTHEEPGIFCHGHTFGGNPLACAAALASLELFDETDLLANVRRRGEQLIERLRQTCEHPAVGDLRGRGLAIGIELVADRDAKTPYDPSLGIGRRVCDQAIRRGVWLRPLQDVVTIVPPLAIGDEQVERIATVVDQSLRAVFDDDGRFDGNAATE